MTRYPFHVNGNLNCFTNPFGTLSPSTPYLSSERHEPKRERSEPACAIEDDVHEADAARNGQRDEHDVPDHVDVVALAELRRGQIFGEVKGEHAEETQDRQRQRDHPEIRP